MTSQLKPSGLLSRRKATCLHTKSEEDGSASVLLSVFRRNILLPSSGLIAHFSPTDGQLYSWYPPIVLHSCTVGTHQSHCTAVKLVPTSHTAQLYSWYPPVTLHSCTVGTTRHTAQLYSWYPSVTLHSCTVGIHQSHCTAVQLVPINHTAQLYSW